MKKQSDRGYRRFKHKRHEEDCRAINYNRTENGYQGDLDKDIRQCMRCRNFWGHNNRCANCDKCNEPVKKPAEPANSKCDTCPYNRGEGYCFPCMKDILDARRKPTTEGGQNE